MLRRTSLTLIFSGYLGVALVGPAPSDNGVAAGMTTGRAALQSARRAEAHLRVDTGGAAIGIDVAGMSRGGDFEVRVAGTDSTLPAVAGRYAVTADTVRFTPAFPFVPGVAYHVRLARAPRLTSAFDTTLEVPKVRGAGLTNVTAVYPTSDVLPMNQLKLYVHFSAPMRTGDAAAHARIIDDADGRIVQDAFFSPEDELWDPSQTRLTLLFDPGRIKRGLRPNEEMGVPLRAGHRYRLVIDGGWRDANGDSLRRGYAKQFSVVPPDRSAPRVASWSVTAPRAGSTDTLTVAFGEPMDEALAERLLILRDSSGVPVVGRSVVGRGEDRWHFVPSAPWRAGRYAVDVGTELEDLAGNNLRRLFDTDLRDRSAPRLEERDRISLRVTVPAAASTAPAKDTRAWLHSGPPDIRSADVMTFAPDGLLLVGDSRGSAVFALDVSDTATATSRDATIADIDARLAALLGTTARELMIRDMVVHPKSHNVYLSVARGRTASAPPVLVRVSAGGRLDVVSLAAIRFARASLPSPPRPGLEVEGDSAWKWTISAMAVMDGRLYVAGISNDAFSSTIRQLPIPFTGNVTASGIRMYHAHHLRYETESPITAFAPYTFFGTRYLVAAYACTPIVLFPVDSLRDGAKVTGKTIAELGGGNVVRDILPFDWEGKRYLAVSNRNRSLQLLNATALPNATPLDEHSPSPLATSLYGVTSWLAWGLEAGNVAQVGILHLADFDAEYALAVQRDVETGALNLRPLKKPFLYP